MSGQPIPQDTTGTIVDQRTATAATPPPSQTSTQAATTEATTDGSKDGSEGEPKSLLNQAAPAGAPEAYTAWTVPEGFSIDEAASTEAGTIFKEMGLSQDQGQKLVDFYSKHSKATSDHLSDLVRQQNETWQNEAKNHPDLRGKLDPGGPVLTTISRALDSLGNAQLKADFQAAMDFTGAGNHPAFIRAFYALASKLAEGSHVAGNGPSPLGQQAPGSARPPTVARAMYPNLP
jgi:hypothetical protein